ncbi:MAG: peptide chain release factor N(5)-glutamine methyltransferase [Verrucomicrobia bacterium]|nr:peptide chain release factor N(5)-glutamine methyltransferase [Verrucomicrobiota bacterium]
MKLLLETLTSGAEYLAKRGVEDSRLNMEHLLAHVLGCRRLDLYLRFNEMLQEEPLVPLRALLKRRGEGEPLQHLLGTVEFHGSVFVSDSRALVPRPETEHLVSIVIEKMFRGVTPNQVLDMGAGSGCIGLSLAKAWPQCEVTLADVSEDALELARLNAGRLGLQPKFIRSDLFEKITGDFDLVIANLPYIPIAEKKSLDREVLRDPALALFGGESGLDIIHRFIADCPAHLAEGGRIALELHHDQAKRVSERLHHDGFANIETARDLAGIERFVFAGKPPTLNSEP